MKAATLNTLKKSAMPPSCVPRRQRDMNEPGLPINKSSMAVPRHDCLR
jgi:hypothetical protein